MKKYLPSKKFLYLLGSFLILAIVFFIAFKLLSSKNSFSNSKNTGTVEVDRLAQAGLSVNDLVKKDSDNDGVPDWEEALWGTDKNNKMTFGGMTDAAYIAGKKKDLNIDTSKDDNNLTETEKFAREFFTSYAAMKASGTVDADTINNFSNALGQKIIDPTLVDRYSLTDIKTNNDNSKESYLKYYKAVEESFNSYKAKGLGDELGIVDGQIASSSVVVENQDKLTPIAEAYQNFASDIMKITVPSNLAQEHLTIANSANNTGVSVLSMNKIISDPIVGLSGISQYQKYSDDLITAVGNLETKIKQ